MGSITLGLPRCDGVDTSPDSALLLSIAEFYRLDAAQATTITQQVRDVVRAWEPRAAKLGFKRPGIDLMHGVIDPER